MLQWNILQYLTKMLRQYFSCNKRLKIFLKYFCNIQYYVGRCKVGLTGILGNIQFLHTFYRSAYTDSLQYLLKDGTQTETDTDRHNNTKRLLHVARIFHRLCESIATRQSNFLDAASSLSKYRAGPQSCDLERTRGLSCSLEGSRPDI